MACETLLVNFHRLSVDRQKQKGSNIPERKAPWSLLIAAPCNHICITSFVFLVFQSLFISTIFAPSQSIWFSVVVLIVLCFCCRIFVLFEPYVRFHF